MLTILLIGLCLLNLMFNLHAWYRNKRTAREIEDRRIVQLVRRA